MNSTDYKKRSNFRLGQIREFVQEIARMTEYKYKETWTDDQAEDAIICMNHLIEKARQIEIDRDWS